MSDNSTTIERRSQRGTAIGLRDWLPERMFACIIVGIVERMDLSGLSKEDNTDPAADPAKLLALLFFGYTSGVFASRHLANAARLMESFRYITASTEPDAGVIERFRQRNRHDIERFFVRILGISYVMKQANLGAPRLDRKQLQKRLLAEARVLLKCAETADAQAPGAEQKQVKPDPAPPLQRVHRRAPRTRQTAHDDAHTFTFLPRRQTATAQASEPTQSSLTSLTNTRPHNRYAGPVATTMVLATVGAVFLLAQYVDRRAPNPPAVATVIENGDIQHQIEFASLSDTLLWPGDKMMPAILSQPFNIATAPTLPEVPAEADPIPDAPSGERSEPAADTAEPGTSALQQEQWLLDQPSENHTLQIFWDWERESLETFIAENRLDGALAFYKDRRTGKDRYVLLHGSYPTQREALSAIATLPEPVRNNGPWPRTMANIKTTIMSLREATAH
ncbi:MAG: transposase [Thiogranum sp.]|nr:transposase [Thiogranum sp.]